VTHRSTSGCWTLPLDRAGEELPEHRRVRPAGQVAAGELEHGVGHVTRVDRVERRRHRGGELGADPCGVLRLGQALGDAQHEAGPRPALPRRRVVRA
jgi:hypothetical protein